MKKRELLASRAQASRFSPNCVNLSQRFRSFIRRFFLKAFLFEAWLSVRSMQFASKFGRLLVSTSKTQFSETRVAVRPKTETLRHLLFISENMWERRELLPELRKICEVDFVDVREARVTPDAFNEYLDVERITQKLLSLKSANYDLIVVYLRSSLLSEALLSFLRQTWSAPLVGLNLDDKTEFEHLEIFPRTDRPYRAWASQFDCNFSNTRSMIELYHAYGFPCFYLPTGFHYDSSRPPATEKFRYQTSFVGSYKPERGKFIRKLERLGIHVAVFGSGWSNPRFVDDGWTIYAGSQINLGIGYNINGKQVTNLKNRDFECPGAGGCYLTTFDWELAELFHVGEEILCYRDIHDLAEVWSFYVRRPERCRQIAEAGKRRAIREHTWENRFRNAFSALGFRTVND
jgi:hypothetical protein